MILFLTACSGDPDPQQPPTPAPKEAVAEAQPIAELPLGGPWSPGLRPADTESIAYAEDQLAIASTTERHYGQSWLRVRPNAESVVVTAGSGEREDVRVVVERQTDPSWGVQPYAVGQGLRSGDEILLGVEVWVNHGAASESWHDELVVVALPADASGKARHLGTLDIAGHMHMTVGSAFDWGGDVLVTERGLETHRIWAHLGQDSLFDLPPLEGLEAMDVGACSSSGGDTVVVARCKGVDERPADREWPSPGDSCTIQGVYGIAPFISSAAAMWEPVEVDCGWERPGYRSGA